MINMYAYTYPNARIDGFMLVKVGDSHREADVRIAEQGGAAEYEAKTKIGEWPNLVKIKRDYDVHYVLKQRGLWHKEGAGTEWFKLPVANEKEAFAYIDEVIAQLETRKARKSLALRVSQERTLRKAMEYIDQGKAEVSLIANLAPRFGKTLWALELFNRISKKYNNRVMLLPAYWLSVHTSFVSEVDEFEDFDDIIVISPDSVTAADDANDALSSGKRILVPMSLHGELDQWCEKHAWIADLDNNDIFMFADEGDFGTHTENQVAKLDFLFA